MSIQFTVLGLNPRPSEHESPPITTRPGLPPKPIKFLQPQHIRYIASMQDVDNGMRARPKVPISFSQLAGNKRFHILQIFLLRSRPLDNDIKLFWKRSRLPHSSKRTTKALLEVINISLVF